MHPFNHGICKTGPLPLETLGETVTDYGETRWCGFSAKALRSTGCYRLRRYGFTESAVALYTAGRRHGWIRRHRGSAKEPTILNPGDIKIFAKDHEFDAASCEGNSQLLLIKLDPDRLASLGGATGGLAEHALNPTVVRGDMQLLALLTSIRLELEAGSPSGRLYAESLSLALATYLYKRYTVAPTAPSQNAQTLSPRQRAEVIAYAKAHLNEDIGLQDLAAVAGFSPSHFTRLFKNSFGIPPYQFLLRERVAEAQRLLRSGRTPIAEVALALGFSSQSHFTTVFRRVTGTTPRRERFSS